MAQPMLNLGGDLSPEQQIRQQQIARQQKMAELLMQQGQQTPQGQIVGNRFVAPSFFQYAAPLLQGYVGRKELEKVEGEQLKLAKELREQGVQETQRLMNVFGGRPATPEQVTEMAGPYTDNVPMPTAYMAAQPAIEANPRLAYAEALNMQSPQARALLPQIATEAFKKPEAFTLPEGSIRFQTMPDGTVRQVATGGEKPRAPLQIDTGTAIELRDPANPTVVLQKIPKSQMPTAGQVVERDDGTFLIDTRTGQARPVMGQGGQPLQGGGKPLTEVQGNAVGFAARAIEANRIATNLEKQGVRDTGAIRTAVGGIAGMTPFVGEQLEQGVRSVFNVAPTFLGGTSAEQQQVEQARRDFVSAILRPESGAAIGVQEAKNEEKKYFPQAGDTETVIQQKQQSRLKAIEGLKAKAGPSGVRQINQITGQTQGGGNVVDFNQLPTGRR
jgi:hypothetical protein